MRNPDRLNRVVLLLVSLVLLGAGGYALARGYEAFGREQADDEVLLEPVRDFVDRYQTLFWIAVLALCLIVSYLALRWLVAQFRSPRLTQIDLTGEGSKGSTHLRAAGASDALANDIETYRGVSSASARLIEDGERPEVDVRVDVNDDADVSALRTKMEEEALPRFCRALEVSAVDARLHLRLTEPAPRLVR
ncbi:MAG: alkaline shock response membrane anchor protein AmaP [Actinomycetota bacterium]|nr:alkaline shock response membrane anchor protein AmaP [Actinomycetota bacterium]